MKDKERLEEIKKKWCERFMHLDVKWLIEQAEQLEKIKKLANVEEITLADFAKEVLRIIEGREIPTRKQKS